ncbi:sulfurtransferase [candidate division KSB1 bacterium]|nr:sulfurtransferase [candidate division KSB1 bacterium]
MKKRIVFQCLIALVLVLTQLASAQLISSKELANIIDGDNVVVISTRKSADYDKVHIKGAVNVWHSDLYQAGDVKGLLKSPAEIAKILGSKGISEKKTLVVYDGGKNITSGRIYWMLKYLGCQDVRILGGGMKNWRKARKPVTRKATEITAITFSATPQEALIVKKDYVKAHLEDSGVVLVDVRALVEFDGEKGLTARMGHIPGAINFEYKLILNEDGTLKSKEDIAKIMADAGVTSDKEVILYCETSARAGIVYMALTALLEYPKVKVYDGAFFEWAADASCPVE